MGYVEFLVHTDELPIEDSLPLLLINDKYTNKYDNVVIDGNRIRINYDENVKGIRFCRTDDNKINKSNRITKLIHIDTDYFTDMSLMFNNCDYIENISLKGINTSNVTTMRCMFADCSKLKTLDIDDLDVRLVKDMDCMFAGCINLTEINISKWVTYMLEDTSYMFYRCYNLEYVNLSNFNTRKVTNYKGMFNSVYKDLVAEVGGSFTIPDLDIKFDRHITCTDIILNPSEHILAMNRFKVQYTLVPANVNVGTTEIICTPNIVYLGDYEFALYRNIDVNGTITFKHDTVVKSINVTYCKYIEYTLQHKDNVTLLEGCNIPYIYYEDGTCDRNFIEICIHLNDGTILDNFDNDIDINDIEKIRLYYNGENVTSVKFYKPGVYNICYVNNIDYFETTGFTDASYMFYNCQYLTDIDLDMFNSELIVNTEGMFYNCRRLETVNMQTWNSNNIKNYKDMFIRTTDECIVTVGPEWFLIETDVSLIGKIVGLIIRCADIKFPNDRILLNNKIKIFKFSYTLVPERTRDIVSIRTGPGITLISSRESTYAIDTNITDRSYIEVTCGDVVRRCVVEYIDMPFIEYTVNNSFTGSNDYLDQCLKITYDIELGIDRTEVTAVTIPYLYRSTDLLPSRDFKRIEIKLKNGQTQTALHTRLADIETVRLYYDPTNITGIKFYNELNPEYESHVERILYIDTTGFTDMSYMFNRCTSITDFNKDILNTSNVNNMQGMFAGCTGLTKLNLDNFNVSNVLWLERMFMGCSNLEELSFLHWDTRKVSSIANMFNNCSKLKTIDISSLRMDNLENMSGLFANCSNLTNIIMNNIDTKNVTNMSTMFYGCSSLINIDLSSLNTENVVSMSNMFNRCTSLEKISLSKFNTKSLEDMSYMFSNCYKLKKINLSKFKTDRILNMNSCFEQCTSLLHMDLRNFKINAIGTRLTSINSLFRGCESINAIEMTSFNLINLSNSMYYANMFQGVPDRCEIYIGYNFKFTENELQFKGKFNSHNITYEQPRNNEYIVGFYNDKFYNEELPGLICDITPDDCYKFSAVNNDNFKGLISTNNGIDDSIAYKRILLDLRHSPNNTTDMFVEVGMSCNTDLHNKVILELSQNPEMPKWEYKANLNRNFISFNYYLDRNYIFSGRVTMQNVYYLHILYRKTNSKIDDDFVLINYIRFKTDSKYFEDYNDKAFQPMLCDFREPEFLYRRYLDPYNNLPWIKYDKIIMKDGYFLEFKNPQMDYSKYPIYFNKDESDGNGTEMRTSSKGLTITAPEYGKHYTKFCFDLREYTIYSDKYNVELCLSNHIHKEGIVRVYAQAMVDSGEIAFFLPILSQNNIIKEPTTYNLALPAGYRYYIIFEVDNSDSISLEYLGLYTKKLEDINYNVMLDFTNRALTNIIEDELERITFDDSILKCIDNDFNNLPNWIDTGFNCKYPMLNARRNGKYGLTTSNWNIDSSISNRYFRLDLSGVKNKVEISIKYNLSTQCKGDYFAIHLTHSPITPPSKQIKNMVIRHSGITYTNIEREVSTSINIPGIYYLHFNYIKDASNRNGFDTVLIKSIEIKEIE